MVTPNSMKMSMMPRMLLPASRSISRMFANFSTSDQMAEADLTVVRRWIGDSEAWVRHLLATAHEYSDIVAIVAMGSAVRARGHRRSDVDLLVVYDERRPKLQPPVEVD